MSNKKIIFSILIVLLILSLLFLIPNNTFGRDLGLGELDEYDGGSGGTGSVRLQSIAGVAFTIIRTIGTVISVVVLIIIGIRYMLGSVEERAEYKKTLVPYVVGAFLLFTGTLLPDLIYTIVTNF